MTAVTLEAKADAFLALPRVAVVGVSRDARAHPAGNAIFRRLKAGPRTVFESNAKRADEHLVLEDLRRATKVIARTLNDLLRAAPLAA